MSLISTFSTLAGGHPLFFHFVSGVSDINVSLTRENDVDFYRSTSRLDLTCRLCTNMCPRGANDNRLSRIPQASSAAQFFIFLSFFFELLSLRPTDVRDWLFVASTYLGVRSKVLIFHRIYYETVYDKTNFTSKIR